MTAARVTWRAAADRVAHAEPGGPRTLCGLLATPERHAWPAERRCAACEAFVERQEAPRCRR